MESSISKYSILFRVRVLHHYFLDVRKKIGNDINLTVFDDLSSDKQKDQLQKYNIDTWLSVVPDKPTTQLLSDKGLIFKQLSDGFAVFTAIANKKPLRDITDSKFVFDLFFRNDGAEHSALPMIRTNGKTNYYLFSNEIAAASGNPAPSLCQLPLAFDSSKNYSEGEIVTDGGSHYQALNKADNKAKARTNANYWTKIKKSIRYANTSNLVERPTIPPDATADEVLRIINVQIPPLAFGRVEISENSSIPNAFKVLSPSPQDEVRQQVFEIRINHL